MKAKLLFITLMSCICSLEARAVIIPGWLDWNGNPVHTEDEFDVRIDATVTKAAQGYRYTYTLVSLPGSRQHINIFEVYLPDPYTSVVGGTESSPWMHSRGWYPYTPYARPSEAVPPGYVYPKEYWRISWVAYRDFDKLQPGNSASGFTFVSPYPPGLGETYLQGYSHPPVQRVGGPPLGEEDAMPVAWTQRSKYGTGKVVPVVGPVKRGLATDSYTILGCAGGVCDVQLDITGPMDPYGTVYSYRWTGPFGVAAGARPVVRLAAGTHQVSVSVSDPYATLATATMPITVVDPNPPANGGNAGGGNAGGAVPVGGQGASGGADAASGVSADGERSGEHLEDDGDSGEEVDETDDE
ncbi:MAG: hypothetical protein R8K47_08225 [Mariprofundaceae bacterium]